MSEPARDEVVGEVLPVATEPILRIVPDASPPDDIAQPKDPSNADPMPDEADQGATDEPYSDGATEDDYARLRKLTREFLGSLIGLPPEHRHPR